MKRLCIAWLSCAVTAAVIAGCSGAPKTGIARGNDLYDNCVPCHGEKGRGSHDLGAPSIAGLPAWYVDAQLTKFSKAIRGAHPADLEGARMRPMARTLKGAVEISAVAEYVAQLAPYRPGDTMTGGNVEGGKVRYENLCVTCHSPDGKGNRDLGAPDLTHQSDWYMVAQLQKFKNGMRGAHPEDIQGAQMAAMAQTLEDEQAIKDVVAFIRTLRP